MIQRAVLASALLVSVLLAPCQSAGAAPPSPLTSTEHSPFASNRGSGLGGGGDQKVLNSNVVIITAADGTTYAAPARGAGAGPSKPTQSTTLRPACTGTSGDAAFCGRLTVATPCAADPTASLFQATTRYFADDVTSDPYLVCVGGTAPGAPGAGPAAVPTYTLAQVQEAITREFNDLVPPTSTVQVRPEGAALLNYPAIFYATEPAPEQITGSGVLFGVLPYTITGAPVDHEWTVDAGTPAALTLAADAEGRPWTESERVRLSGGAVSDYYVGHTFRSTGQHSAQLTTSWGGTFSVEGFGTLPVPGTVARTSAPAAFDVREARGELIR